MMLVHNHLLRTLVTVVFMLGMLRVERYGIICHVDTAIAQMLYSCLSDLG
jgi:hypothetical protein